VSRDNDDRARREYIALKRRRAGDLSAGGLAACDVDIEIFVEMPQQLDWNGKVL
jgi:hypothetical protein